MATIETYIGDIHDWGTSGVAVYVKQVDDETA